MTTRTSTIALLVAAALGAGACGDDNTAEPANTSPAETVTAAPPPQATTAEATTTTESSPAQVKYDISKDRSLKPAIPKPTGDPPAALVIQDIVKGTGAAAKAGDLVTVDYVGVSHSTGAQFDASWDAQPYQPFQFPLGQGQVIPGWDQGVEGMKKGGRRLLVIPPDLAYGPQGQGDIGPNETLLFVIDLRKLG